MKVFIEAFKPERRLIIVGAGHIGLALYKLACVLDFKIIVIDERRSFANKKKFPCAEKVIVAMPNNAIKKIVLNQDTYVVIVTHTHKYDYAVLKAIIGKSAKYIGMIGSKGKVAEIFHRLMRQGIAKDKLHNVRAPVGFNLGGDSPEEIALSILAEIVSVANGAKGTLRFKKIVSG